MCREAEQIQIPSTHCGGYGGDGGCVRLPASASASFLFPPDLLPPPRSSSLHELLSFPQAGNESCCLWCEGEPGGGNNGAERKCQTPAHACPCMFRRVFCVCLRTFPFSRVIKDPIRCTRRTPLNPCRGIKQRCPVLSSSHSTSFRFCLPFLPVG